MKLLLVSGAFAANPSPPARGAWIEIAPEYQIAMGRDPSPPARGAWIEIMNSSRSSIMRVVAPRTGGVD